MSAGRAVFVLVVLAASATQADTRERPLPGFPRLVYRTIELHDACSSELRVIRRTGRVADRELAAVLTWPRLTGVDLSGDDPGTHRASLARSPISITRTPRRRTSAPTRRGSRPTARSARRAPTCSSTWPNRRAPTAATSSPSSA